MGKRRGLAAATREVILQMEPGELQAARPKDIYGRLEKKGFPEDLTMRSTVSKLLKEAKAAIGSEVAALPPAIRSQPRNALPENAEGREYARKLLYEAYKALGGDVDVLCEEVASLKKWAVILLSKGSDGDGV